MPRPYSDEFLLSLNTLDAERLGVQLAKKCVSANLPALYVARAFNVSRMTIHSWFRGQYIRDKNCTKINNFIKIVDKEFDEGTLPAITFTDAKKFIEEKTINKI
jgi:hypothetical protein